MTLADKLVAAMRASSELKITVQDANKKPVEVNLPLLGFGLAFDRPSDAGEVRYTEFGRPCCGAATVARDVPMDERSQLTAAHRSCLWRCGIRFRSKD